MKINDARGGTGSYHVTILVGCDGKSWSECVNKTRIKIEFLLICSSQVWQLSTREIIWAILPIRVKCISNKSPNPVKRARKLTWLSQPLAQSKAFQTRSSDSPISSSHPRYSSEPERSDYTSSIVRG